MRARGIVFRIQLRRHKMYIANYYEKGDVIFIIKNNFIFESTNKIYVLFY